MIASLLAHEKRFGLNSEGADIRSQNVLLAMRYCRRRRSNVNLDGVASSKRSLFWMIVAIAAAYSVLHERAAFATALGRFAKTL